MQANSSTAHSVRELVEKAFKCVDIVIQWRGEREEEVGVDSATGNVLVRIDKAYYRPAEVS